MNEEIEWTLEEAYRYAQLIMGTAAGQGKTYSALLWALEQLDKTTTELAESAERAGVPIEYTGAIVALDTNTVQVMPVQGRWSGKTHTRPDFPVDPADYE